MPNKVKTKKKKKTNKKKKNNDNQYISGTSFTHAELKKYINTIKKIRNKKNGKKKKKIGLTNTISFLNLLYNADKEKQKKPKRNLLKSHPFNYPSLIHDNNVDHVWNATKVRTSKNKDGLVSNLNEVYRQLYGFNLLAPPPKRQPIHKRGSINIKTPDEMKSPSDISVTTTNKNKPLPKKPSRPPPPQKTQTLPKKPSYTPPPPQKTTLKNSDKPSYLQDSDSSSSSEEDE